MKGTKMAEQKVVLRFVGKGKQRTYSGADNIECNVEQPQTCILSVLPERANQLLSDHSDWFQLVSGHSELKENFGYRDRQLKEYERNTPIAPVKEPLKKEVAEEVEEVVDEVKEEIVEKKDIDQASDAPEWSWHVDDMKAWLVAKNLEPVSDKKTEVWAQVKEVLASP